MSLGAIRNLSPDFIRASIFLLDEQAHNWLISNKDVLPKLPPPPPSDAPFNRSNIGESMKRMGAYKEYSINTYWPELRSNVSIENIKIPMRDGIEVDLRIYTPKRETSTINARKVVYSLHGGGFIAGNIDSEDLINRQLCSYCNVLVFSLEYRLAPEHPVVPVILNDVEDGLKWTYLNAPKYGGDTSKSIIVSGTSSGAAMAATLGFRARALDIPVKGLVLRQPAFIFNTYEKGARKEWLPLLKSRVENADAPMLSGATVIHLNKLIGIPLGELHKPNNFPIFASKEELARMPPTYVVEAPCDPVVDEVELYVNLLREAGVAVKVKSYEGMPHGFHAHHVLQAARDEMKDTAEGVNWLIELAGQ